MNRRSLRTHACAIGLLLASATPALAQRLTLSPTIGVYIPTSELVKAANGEEFKQEIALSVGGRLGLNFGPRFGVVTSVAYVPSSLRFTFNDTEETKIDANLLFGTARATRVRHPHHQSRMAQHQRRRQPGEARWRRIRSGGGQDDVGGVVGATLGFNLGGFLSFYVAAEDYIYGTTFVEAGTLEEKSTQHDVQLALGFGVPLNK